MISHSDIIEEIIEGTEGRGCAWSSSHSARIPANSETAQCSTQRRNEDIASEDIESCLHARLLKR